MSSTAASLRPTRRSPPTTYQQSTRLPVPYGVGSSGYADGLSNGGYFDGGLMRKITAGLFISLDGVVEAPDQWHFPYFNDEMGGAVDAQLGAVDTIFLGRKTYDSFAGAWPDREVAGAEDAEFAKKLGDARKIVVSNSSWSSRGGTPNSWKAISSRPSPPSRTSQAATSA
jgi:hypothetical protein